MKEPSFARTYVLPVTVLFAIPLFSLWFAYHATNRYDSIHLEGNLKHIESDASLSREQRAQARAYVNAVPMSSICSAERRADDPAWIADVCSDYSQFTWAWLAAIAAIALAVFSLGIIALSVGAAFAWPSKLYGNIAIAWNALRATSALQVVLQAGLATFLSFWMTALWLQVYSIKLILVIGVLAVIAIFVVVKSIFQGTERAMPINGELISEQDAPELWSRVRELCRRLDTDPPKQLIAGIDDNFFVTESELVLRDKTLTGRSLYVSLSLLKVLDRAEADAVLSHEMAHFSGGDTAFSRKLSPLLQRFAVYLNALAVGLSRPVFYLMLLYRSGYELALSKERRRREHAADASAGRLVSPEAAARALVRVGAYARYRDRVEEQLFEQRQVHSDLAIGKRVENGFLDYVRTPKLAFDLHESITPHPFDSHPPLKERLSSLGMTWTDDQVAQLLEQPPAATWFESIATAPTLETTMWKEYESRFSAAHEQSLAYRYLPSNDEERVHVERYFPEIKIPLAEGGEVTLNYLGVHAPEWEEPLSFADIKSASVNERMFKRYLDLQLKDGGILGSKKSICLKPMDAQADRFVQDFGSYWGRHQMATGKLAGGS